MVSAAPLGALAEVILEQYGELIEAAIEDAMRRRGSQLPRDFASEPQVLRFGSNELAEMHIQPGNWVVVGRIGDIHPRTIIEINLSSWEWRETLEPLEFRESMLGPSDVIAALPPATRQVAS